MKQFFLLLLMAGALQCKSQNSSNDAVEYFIDSVKMKYSKLYFDAVWIKKIDVIKKGERNNLLPQVFIQTKYPGYLKFLSLAEVQKKYTGKTYNSVVFVLDDKIIKEDISSYAIDSSYILKAEVTEGKDISSLNGRFADISILTIKTRTLENIEAEEKKKIK